MQVTEQITLPSQTPGVTHRLCKHCFTGTDGNARSAYIQAGLHADEHPGLLVIQHLLEHLQHLEAAGRVRGRIVVCPFANPVGMGQQIFGQLPGRFSLANGENFNRNFPDVVAAVETEMDREPPSYNDIPALKTLLVQALGNKPPDETVAALKYHLLREALQHDLFLDLHCDTSSVLHIYANQNQSERALILAACTGVRAVFLEDEAGGFPLDEAYAKAWKPILQRRLVDTQRMGFSATLELRGQADVEDRIAADDALGILRFLAHEGLIELDQREQPMPFDNIEIYPLEGVAHLEANGTGIVAWRKVAGESVTRGELIAEIVPLDTPLGTPRVAITSTVTGILVARHHVKLVRSGQRIGMLAGKEHLPERRSGKLMHAF